VDRQFFVASKELI